MGSFKPPGYCPNCGEYVEEGASSCPSCGSCASTGWNDDSAYDGLDLPDESAEAPRSIRDRPVSLGRLLAIVVIGLALVYFVMMR